MNNSDSGQEDAPSYSLINTEDALRRSKKVLTNFIDYFKAFEYWTR
jgi:hypothetical protein